MALNFSHSHVSEKPMKITEGLSESHDGVFSADIVDVLPSDPFGMDMNNTFTAITGWLEDLQADYRQCERDEIGDGDHQLFARLSIIWNNAMRFQEFPESHWSGSLFGFEGDGSCAGSFVSPTSVDKVMSRVGESSDGGENANVHPALGFCLYHLGVKDLLSVSMVCKSLHSTVCDDSLLWKHIHISQPLNEKINDEALLRLTERAHGTMQCLRIVDCSKITEDCLRKVLERNPQVVKLGVPGCTRISIDGLVSILRDLKSAGKLKVKHLETGGLYGVTKDHYDELLDLLDIDNNVNKTIIQKPRYYHRGYTFASCDDVVRALDIEMCRKCENWRIVYDCPAEDCKGKEECRACSLCVQRCVQCGRCINGVYEETFCLEFLCSGCSKLLKLPLV
ncbi:F-box protein SKIP14 [Brassica rapa]|uniref:F-box domain-containing protein n=1 Tax=Brassica campestris TaxID=3711 RepID=M4F5J7_BRACM|nr:F-box protein SKIP14 [Brassica rapa]XP_033139852.1 F-box protein SKIP14 [Brassica rapa]